MEKIKSQLEGFIGENLYYGSPDYVMQFRLQKVNIIDDNFELVGALFLEGEWEDGHFFILSKEDAIEFCNTESVDWVDNHGGHCELFGAGADLEGKYGKESNMKKIAKLQTVWNEGSGDMGGNIWIDDTDGYFTAMGGGWNAPNDFTACGIYQLIRNKISFMDFVKKASEVSDISIEKLLSAIPTDTDKFWVVLGNRNYFALTGQQGLEIAWLSDDEELADGEYSKIEGIIDEEIEKITAGTGQVELAEMGKDKDIFVMGIGEELRERLNIKYIDEEEDITEGNVSKISTRRKVSNSTEEEVWKISDEDIDTIVDEAVYLQHDTNYHSWYLYKDGSITGAYEEVDSYSHPADMHNGEYIQVLQVGTGSIPCNCDWCSGENAVTSIYDIDIKSEEYDVLKERIEESIQEANNRVTESKLQKVSYNTEEVKEDLDCYLEDYLSNDLSYKNIVDIFYDEAQGTDVMNYVENNIGNQFDFRHYIENLDNMKKGSKKIAVLYMNLETGHADSYTGWVDHIPEEELEASGYKTNVELFQSYLDNGTVVKVVSPKYKDKFFGKIIAKKVLCSGIDDDAIAAMMLNREDVETLLEQGYTLFGVKEDCNETGDWFVTKIDDLVEYRESHYWGIEDVWNNEEDAIASAIRLVESIEKGKYIGVEYIDEYGQEDDMYSDAKVGKKIVAYENCNEYLNDISKNTATLFMKKLFGNGIIEDESNMYGKKIYLYFTKDYELIGAYDVDMQKLAYDADSEYIVPTTVNSRRRKTSAITFPHIIANDDMVDIAEIGTIESNAAVRDISRIIENDIRTRFNLPIDIEVSVIICGTVSKNEEYLYIIIMPIEERYHLYEGENEIFYKGTGVLNYVNGSYWVDNSESTTEGKIKNSARSMMVNANDNMEDIEFIIEDLILDFPHKDAEGIFEVFNEEFPKDSYIGNLVAINIGAPSAVYNYILDMLEKQKLGKRQRKSKLQKKSAPISLIWKKVPGEEPISYPSRPMDKTNELPIEKSLVRQAVQDLREGYESFNIARKNVADLETAATDLRNEVEKKIREMQEVGRYAEWVRKVQGGVQNMCTLLKKTKDNTAKIGDIVLAVISKPIDNKKSLTPVKALALLLDTIGDEAKAIIAEAERVLNETTEEVEELNEYKLLEVEGKLGATAGLLNVLSDLWVRVKALFDITEDVVKEVEVLVHEIEQTEREVKGRKIKMMTGDERYENAVEMIPQCPECGYHNVAVDFPYGDGIPYYVCDCGWEKETPMKYGRDLILIERSTRKRER